MWPRLRPSQWLPGNPCAGVYTIAFDELQERTGRDLPRDLVECLAESPVHLARWRRQHLPGSARSNRRWHRLARGGARARAMSDPANWRCAATPAGRTPGAGNGSPAGPIRNRFEGSIVDPTVIALLGRAAAALVARQRGAVLADCPHLPHDAIRTDQKMGVDDRLARKLDVALVVAHEEVCHGYGRFGHHLRIE